MKTLRACDVMGEACRLVCKAGSDVLGPERHRAPFNRTPLRSETPAGSLMQLLNALNLLWQVADGAFDPKRFPELPELESSTWRRQVRMLGDGAATWC